MWVNEMIEGEIYFFELCSLIRYGFMSLLSHLLMDNKHAFFETRIFVSQKVFKKSLFLRGLNMRDTM